jgi:hypothetical protein
MFGRAGKAVNGGDIADGAAAVRQHVLDDALSEKKLRPLNQIVLRLARPPQVGHENIILPPAETPFGQAVFQRLDAQLQIRPSNANLPERENRVELRSSLSPPGVLPGQIPIIARKRLAASLERKENETNFDGNSTAGFF